MSRGGARPALALSLTGSGQCPAAEGRGPAYAHKLISSASAGLPAQSACLHCGPRAFSCWRGGGDQRSTVEGLREEGRYRGERSTERGGRGELAVTLPLQKPAKSLGYMENTICLQGNSSTSANKNSPHVWPWSLSASLSGFPHRRQARLTGNT